MFMLHTEALATVLQRMSLRKKLKSETQIEDARKGDHLRSGKMRCARISDDRNWLDGG
jgi:hypothetical protein